MITQKTAAIAWTDGKVFKVFKPTDIITYPCCSINISEKDRELALPLKWAMALIF